MKKNYIFSIKFIGTILPRAAHVNLGFDSDRSGAAAQLFESSILQSFPDYTFRTFYGCDGLMRTCVIVSIPVYIFPFSASQRSGGHDDLP